MMCRKGPEPFATTPRQLSYLVVTDVLVNPSVPDGYSIVECRNGYTARGMESPRRRTL